MNTTRSKIQHLPLSALTPHPDNRPLGIDEEKVDQLAAMMTANGYDESKPIKARPNGSPGSFQIIEGEHRWRAAQKAGIESVPVFIKEMSDEEALIELVAGNVQTDNHPLDYGRIARKVADRSSKKGGGYKHLADKWALPEKSIERYARADEVKEVAEQKDTSVLLLEYSLLLEIRKCYESNWLWFHDLIISKSLSKTDAIEISKRIRAIDKAANHSASVFNLTELKQQIATAKERQYIETLSLIEAIENCAEKLPESCSLFRYNFTDKAVEQYTYLARETFLSRIANAKEHTRPDVFKAYESALKTIQQQTKDNAEKDKAHYEDEDNREAAEERARAEWEAFMPESGKWYELGPHLLYCGDNRDKAFLDGLPEKAVLAFADPPYNAGVDEWDRNFKWEQDYLQDVAEIVAVTPGISSISDFFKATKMEYKWSLSTWIKNGMTRGALGFGNWIYTAIFSRLDSIHRNAQDFNSITIKTSDNEGHYHKGHKPNEYMDFIINAFTNDGDTVIDNFLGSGTTLLRCDHLHRVCYGAEKDPLACKEIIKQYKDAANEN